MKTKTPLVSKNWKASNSRKEAARRLFELAAIGLEKEKLSDTARS